ncbi:MAG: AAA family ATPase [Gammaproteobacteria bacterium]
MPISSIAINNFRGLCDFRMEGAAPVFNLLVGPSEIGKTSVLEAMSLMSVSTDMAGAVGFNRMRGATVNNQSDAVAAAKSLFHNFRLQPIELETAIKSAFGNVTAKIEIVPVMDDNVVSYREADKISAQMGTVASTQTARFNGFKRTVEYARDFAGKGYNFFRIRDDGVRLDKFVEEEAFFRIDEAGKKHALSPKDMDFLLWNAVFICYPDIRVAIDAATTNKREAAIVDILKMINPQVAGFALSEKTPLIDIGLDQMMPLHIAGDGLRRVLGMLGNLCSKSYSVHLEDEIGAGVYFGALPTFLRAVFDFAIREGKQIFATTHSKDVLVALKEVLTEREDLREDAAVFSFMHDKKGKVRAGAYLYEDIDRCIANDIEIR